MAVKKATTPVESESIEEVDGPTPVEEEVNAEVAESPNPFTFTVDIDGEPFEFVDAWNRSDKAPGALLMMGKAEMAGKYAPSLLEQIIGEDQIMAFFDAGGSSEETAEIIAAWSKASGLKN